MSTFFALKGLHNLAQGQRQRHPGKETEPPIGFFPEGDT
jgi:hypothetical protein